MASCQPLGLDNEAGTTKNANFLVIYVLGFLIIALLVKDTVPIGDIYFLRGLSQGTALCVGLWWMATKSEGAIHKKYLLLMAYCFALLLTAFESRNSTAVVLQVLSVFAVVLFCIAFLEGQPGLRQIHPKAIIITSIALILVCLGSLVLYRVSPQATYDLTTEGRVGWDGVHRFRGLYGKPAQMGAAAGLLLGLSLFARPPVIVRILGVVASVPCLYLTGSRSFWVGALCGVAGTGMLYLRKKRLFALAGGLVILVLVLLAVIFEIRMSSETESKILRSESLEKFSGRTTVWAMALSRFEDKPLLGYGYTFGHHAFLGKAKTEADDPSYYSIDLLREQRFALHNGYVQALLDSGILGTTFYVLIIVYSIWRLVWLDRQREFGSALYALLFLAVSNVGETLIFTPATFHAMFFWYVAVLGFCLQDTPMPTSEQVSVTAEGPPPPTSQYPLLSTPGGHPMNRPGS